MKTSSDKTVIFMLHLIPVQSSRTGVKSWVLLRRSSLHGCEYLVRPSNLFALADYIILSMSTDCACQVGLGCQVDIRTYYSPPAKRKLRVNSTWCFEFYGALSKHKLCIVLKGIKDRPCPYFLSGCN